MKRESSRPFAGVPSSGEIPTSLAELIGRADAPGYLHNDGDGNFGYSTPADGGGAAGPTGSLGEVGDALQLYWLYGDESPAFELFSDIFSWRDIAPIKIIEATAGDDTVDLETTEDLKVGSTYVVYDAAGRLIETIEISKILTAKRLRARLALAHSLTTVDGAFLARTSAEVFDRFAIFSDGDAAYSRVLDALRVQANGRMVLRRSSDGTGTFTVSYRVAEDTVWIAAKRTDTRSRLTGTRDEEYEIAAGGELEFRITYAGSSADDNDRVEFFALTTTPRTEAATFVEQPTNASPADQAINVGQTPALTGSAYRSLYGLEQGGAHFQVAKDAAFSDIVVNSSNDWLASWVNKTGYSENWKGVVALAANKFLAVANGVSVRLNQAGAISFTGAVTGDLRCVDADTGLALAAGAAGAIRTSADEGATYTARAAANAYGGTFNGAAVRGSRVALVGTGAEIQFAGNGVIFAKVMPDGGYAGDFTGLAGDGAGNVIAVGTLGGIQTSATDGQNGWTKREAPGGYAGIYRGAALLPSGYGLAAGDDAALHETLDYGATWRDGHPDPSFAGDFFDVAIVGNHAVAIGSGGEIQVKVLPDGEWQSRSAGGGATGTFRAIALDNNADALALGDAGLVQRTSRLTGATIAYTVPAGSDMLETNKVYFWRLRYSDILDRWSPWSTGTAFATSATFNYVRQPQNLAPADDDDGVSLLPTFQSSAFSPVGEPDTHAASRWQVATDLAFAAIVHDSGEVDDLTVYTLPEGQPLLDEKQYFWRVAHKGAVDGFSAWSAPTVFATQAQPNRPTITAPANNATNVAIAPTVTTSAFSMPGGGVHDASQYQVSTTSSFASLIYDSGWTGNLTSHEIPAGGLAFNTSYFIRARHRESGGQASPWSALVGFKTMAAPTVQDVFATTLYTANGGLQTITNGIDLAGDGGLVWEKRRNNGDNHFLVDSERGLGKFLSTNNMFAEGSVAPGNEWQFKPNGFSTRIYSTGTIVAWAHKQAPKFFKAAKFTHVNGAPTDIDLSSLGEVGFVTIKRRSSTGDWFAWHRSLTPGTNLRFNVTDAASPTAAHISVNGTTLTFAAGAPHGDYVLYAWAHDPSPSGFIQCGVYTGNGSTSGPVVPLGWSPQWLMNKRIDFSQSTWNIYDAVRSPANPRQRHLSTLGGQEYDSPGYAMDFTSAGFQPRGPESHTNAAGGKYAFMAIRGLGA